jgi:hypothetical protein
LIADKGYLEIRYLDMKNRCFENFDFAGVGVVNVLVVAVDHVMSIVERDIEIVLVAVRTRTLRVPNNPVVVLIDLRNLYLI